MNRIATSLPYTELEVATGNYDISREPIDRIILHTMVGTWQGAAARFDNPTSQVSAHYGVKLDGSLIHWLEETFTAYHAGDYATNQRSIGIEHEDNGDYNGTRPDALYEGSAKLVADICKFYNIPIDRAHILKHSEVSDQPTGCPDALNIERIVAEAQAQGGGGMANMYGSPNQYDLNNPESMKVAVDVLNKLQTGQLIDKAKYDADIQAAKNANNGNQDIVNKYNQLKQDLKNFLS